MNSFDLNSRDVHDLFMLLALILILTIVWRLGNLPRPVSTQLPMQKKRGEGGKKKSVLTSTVPMFVGMLLGILLTQGMRLMSRSDPPEVLNKLVEEQDKLPVCKVPRKGVPPGAEGLPPGVIVPVADLFTRRMWGKPEEDLPSKARYLLAVSVRVSLIDNVNKMVQKFSNEWVIMLFHEDGKMDDWLEFDWAAKAIHVVGPRQTKWWFAKRFLHPDVVDPYEFVFIWDPDLDLSQFDPTKFMELVKRHKLEVVQPAVQPRPGVTLTWRMTQRRTDSDVHMITEEQEGWCRDPKKPPCAGFVEIQAPVFSRSAWRCVWHLIQNDLVHGWGIDFNLWRCAQGPPHEKIGVVDAQYIKHVVVPKKLELEADSVREKEIWDQVQERSKYEWEVFKQRMEAADAEGRPEVVEKEPRIIYTP